MTDFADLAPLLKLRKEVETKLQVEGSEIILKSIRKIFELHPEVKALRWQQYIPYFSDGETPEFSFQEVEVQLASGRTNFHFLYDLEDKKLEKTLNKLDNSLRKMEKTLEVVFGNDKQITITNKSVKIENYSDHD